LDAVFFGGMISSRGGLKAAAEGGFTLDEIISPKRMPPSDQGPFQAFCLLGYSGTTTRER
jgi:hypothetical protein